ncbi:hypothetical protein CI592_07045 [Fischerella thermalis CCMEE 5328]|nr:hypothetical protein CI592_07045 [Fischerella thermalis CCMEE 5328]
MGRTWFTRLSICQCRSIRWRRVNEDGEMGRTGDGENAESNSRHHPTTPPPHHKSSFPTSLFK